MRKFDLCGVKNIRKQRKEDKCSVHVVRRQGDHLTYKCKFYLGRVKRPSYKCMCLYFNFVKMNKFLFVHFTHICMKIRTKW